MSANHFKIKGLSNEEVILARQKFGPNKLDYKKENTFLDTVVRIAKDPMIILLLVAASIYFISGEVGDGIFLVAAIVLIASISLYQDSRSKNALEKLKDYSQPKVQSDSKRRRGRDQKRRFGGGRQSDGIRRDSHHSRWGDRSLKRFFGKRIHSHGRIAFGLQG